ncbi:MAG: hypothetical protein JW732_07905 [Dehalococcoidia bacterium]|nr:hypothetical protein [Dehalococcoidia bacterium]
MAIRIWANEHLPQWLLRHLEPIESISTSITNFACLIYSFYLIVYSLAFNKPLIHVIGDSHVLAFRRIRPFSVHHIGPATAHNLKRLKSTTNSNEKLFTIIDKISKDDKASNMVILVFGEIDCRIHIYQQFKENDEMYTISELIDMTISNYGEVIEQIRKLGMNPCVYSVPPPQKTGKQLWLPALFYPRNTCRHNQDV